MSVEGLSGLEVRTVGLGRGSLKWPNCITFSLSFALSLSGSRLPSPAYPDPSRLPFLGSAFSSQMNSPLAFLVVFTAGIVLADDLTEYPIKEEHCENFGECLTACVKKLPPNRQFTEIVWPKAQLPMLSRSCVRNSMGQSARSFMSPTSHAVMLHRSCVIISCEAARGLSQRPKCRLASELSTRIRSLAGGLRRRPSPSIP